MLGAGILYTSRPRGDIGGIARFVDQKNRLCCEVTFGKVANAYDPVLLRPDALCGTIFRFSDPSALPKTVGKTVSAGSIRALSSVRLQAAGSICAGMARGLLRCAGGAVLQVKRELKSKGSLSGLANALSSVLSASSLNQLDPEFTREQDMASCSGNWLSHLDWDGSRWASQWPCHALESSPALCIAALCLRGIKSARLSLCACLL
jgi:hypothetical protein